jgi:hypothetical protein
MHRLGLALSGGGFRATLYHLGVIRCLKDAGVLPKVTHITTVSGGSIIGAHLVLNWDRYCGTPEQFDDAAAEIIRFVQLDVRNQIVRRFPLAAALNRARSMLLDMSAAGSGATVLARDSLQRRRRINRRTTDSLCTNASMKVFKNQREAAALRSTWKSHHDQQKKERCLDAYHVSSGAIWDRRFWPRSFPLR